MEVDRCCLVAAHLLGHRPRVRGANILPFAPHSSTGCAICDPLIAIWCFAGGPSVPALFVAQFNRLTHRPMTPPATVLRDPLTKGAPVQHY